MSCPAYPPDCMATGIGIGTKVVRGMKVTAHAASATVHGVTSVAGSVGRFLPLLFVLFILWLLMKAVSTGKAAAVAVTDGYTGGAASKTKDVKQTVVNRSRDKGKQMRYRREHVRGPQVQPHTGGGVEIIHRSNDQLGKPKRVVVCAADPGDAQATLQARLGGRGRWVPAGSKPCACKAAGHKDYVFTRQA